ncbi:MAG: insulinase family protein [Candidatus Kapabacteria bacterium]|nr:insulinase family protein [Candidatus Kapabacteria bacterium]
MPHTIQPIMRALVAVLVCVGLTFTASAQGSGTTTKKKSSTKTTKTQTSKKQKTSAATSAKSEGTAPAAQAEKLDLGKQPGPLEATTFSFPAFEEFTTESGLHVFVIENHEQPTVNINLIVRGGEALDAKGKEGAISMAVDMLSKGTATRTAQQIAETMDGLGASISGNVGAEASTITASTLKKHIDVVMTVLADQLLNPSFPAEELEKLREQYLANVASQRSEADELAQALARKVIYGMDHPMARRQSEGSVKSITVDDVKSAYGRVFMPNNASIAFVGDVTVKEVKNWLKKHLLTWKSGATPVVEMPPMTVSPQGVYFIPRKGSVQSAVIITSKAPPVTDPKFDAASILAAYIGGGFGSRLFATLRETYSWTYSPFGFVTRGKMGNRFAVGAEVRTPVTDSAIHVIVREVAQIVAEGPNEEDLLRQVANTAGQYKIAFENAGTVASLLQNAWQQGRPLDDVKNQISRIELVGVTDVQEAAAKYMGLFDLRMVVVGDPAVRSMLEQFGTINEFTLDIEPVTGSEFEPVPLTIAELVDKYANAMGGRAALEAVTSDKMTGTVELTVQGQKMSGSYVQTQQGNTKLYTSLDLAMMKQASWFDGTTAWFSIGGSKPGVAPDDQREQLRADAVIFPALRLAAPERNAQIKGRRGGLIYVDVTSPSGRAERYGFDAETYLLTRVEYDETTPNGPLTVVTTYGDYSDVAGVKMANTITMANPIYTLTVKGTHLVNQAIDDATFRPAE